jgi:hypothetical protein
MSITAYAHTKPEWRWVFGTRTERWELVGPRDRDYDTAIPQDVFARQDEATSRAQYLSPNKLG